MAPPYGKFPTPSLLASSPVLLPVQPPGFAPPHRGARHLLFIYFRFASCLPYTHQQDTIIPPSHPYHHLSFPHSPPPFATHHVHFTLASPPLPILYSRHFIVHRISHHVYIFTFFPGLQAYLSHPFKHPIWKIFPQHVCLLFMPPLSPCFMRRKPCTP